MPLHERDLLEVQRVARLYAGAETRILQRLTAYLAAGIDAPDWQTQALARTQRLRQEAVNDLAAVDETFAGIIGTLMDSQYAMGNRQIYADIGKTLPDVQVATDVKRNAVTRLARELSGAAGEGGRALLRVVDDTFRTIIGDVVSDVAAGGTSKRDAMREAVGKFLANGIPSFKDSRGRNWNIQDYVNMATRTGFAAAQIQGHEDALDAAGLDLVIIQPGPRACEICDKWARKILARSGQAGTFTVTNMLTGQPMTITVDDTLAAARAAGFQHPNCRCSIRAYLPGVTDPADIQRPPWDAKGYERQQQQRGHEKAVRQAKMDLAKAQGLGDPAEIAKAKALLAKRQAGLRDHLAANPYLKRRTDRESIMQAGGDEKPFTPRTTPPRPDSDGTAAQAAAIKAETARVEAPAAVPAAEQELMARFARLDTPEDMSRIATKVNPGGVMQINRDYLTNCHYVVAAAEMRARGYDVYARPTVKGTGRVDEQIEGDYAGDRKFTNMKDLTAAETARLAAQRKVRQKSMLDDIEDWAAEYPEGARGYITGAWARGGGGHIWNWEKTAAGIVYHEGQIHAHDSQKAKMNVLNLKRETVNVMRVDDLEPAPGLVSALQSGEEYDLEGAAATRNEISRIDERLASLAPETERLLADYEPVKHIYEFYKRTKNFGDYGRATVQDAYNRYARAQASKTLATRYRSEKRRLQGVLKELEA